MRKGESQKHQLSKTVLKLKEVSRISGLSSKCDERSQSSTASPSFNLLIDIVCNAVYIAINSF
jgi:hypothetical protein